MIPEAFEIPIYLQMTASIKAGMRGLKPTNGPFRMRSINVLEFES